MINISLDLIRLQLLGTQQFMGELLYSPQLWKQFMIIILKLIVWNHLKIILQSKLNALLNQISQRTPNHIIHFSSKIKKIVRLKMERNTLIIGWNLLSVLHPRLLSNKLKRWRDQMEWSMYSQVRSNFNDPTQLIKSRLLYVSFKSSLFSDGIIHLFLYFHIQCAN